VGEPGLELSATPYGPLGIGTSLVHSLGYQQDFPDELPGEIDDVAWTSPQYSRSKVDSAGKTLISDTILGGRAGIRSRSN